MVLKANPRKTSQSCLALYIFSSLLLGSAFGSQDEINIEPVQVKKLEPFQIGDHHDIVISNSDDSSIQPISSNDGKTRTYTLHHENASYLSVHYTSFNLPPECSLKVVDLHGDVHHTLTGQGKLNLGSFWDYHVASDTIKLRLHCNRNDDIKSAIFFIDEYAAGFESTGRRHLKPWQGENDNHTFAKAEDQRDLLSICLVDDKVNAICYKDDHEEEYIMAKAVARLFINGSGGCTGWIVKSSSGNMLLTNNHCIKSQSDVVNTEFEFMGETVNCNDSSSFMSSRGKIFDGVELLRTSIPLDYSLVTLSGDLSMYGELDILKRLPYIGEGIYIPQHAGGRAKAIAMFDDYNKGGQCSIKSFNNYGCTGSRRDVLYSCDTEGGSSGSPVISHLEKKVASLHHCGGGCNGNHGTPISDIYKEIHEFLDRNASPSPSPTTSLCEDSLDPIDLGGVSINCEWAQTVPCTCEQGKVKSHCPVTCEICA